MTAPQPKDPIAQIERTLYDTRSLVGMLTTIFDLFDGHDINESAVRNLWPGLRLVASRVERNLSDAIDTLNRVEMDGAR